jgi:hypothetical protein
VANAVGEVAAGIRAGVGAGSRVRQASTTCAHWAKLQHSYRLSLSAAAGRKPEVEAHSLNSNASWRGLRSLPPGLKRHGGSEGRRWRTQKLYLEQKRCECGQTLPYTMLLPSPILHISSRGRQSRQGDSAHYLIKTQHVQMGKYVESSITLAPEIVLKVRTEATARYGDVLIACSAAGCLGRVAYYTDAERTASTDTHVAIARANPSAMARASAATQRYWGRRDEIASSRHVVAREFRRRDLRSWFYAVLQDF